MADDDQSLTFDLNDIRTNDVGVYIYFSGPSGWSGQSGWSGWSGASGAQGPSGLSGWSGYSGRQGWSGYSGWSGWSGLSGYSSNDGAVDRLWSGYSQVLACAGPSEIEVIVDCAIYEEGGVVKQLVAICQSATSVHVPYMFYPATSSWSKIGVAGIVPYTRWHTMSNLMCAFALWPRQYPDYLDHDHYLGVFRLDSKGVPGTYVHSAYGMISGYSVGLKYAGINPTGRYCWAHAPSGYSNSSAPGGLFFLWSGYQ